MAFDITRITEPTLLLDEARCRANMKRMADKARRLGLLLYPHFKTHQSRTVGKWCSEYGMSGIAVSSLDMATYFAGQGFDDITVAFPVNLRAADQLNRLAAKTGLSVLISGKDSIEKLDHVMYQPIRVFIEIDAGYGRCGVESGDEALIQHIIDICKSSRYLSFRGFYIHPGNSYHLHELSFKQQVHQNALDAMAMIKSKFDAPGREFRLGDTPNCTLMDEFGVCTSLGPGNYVFYDYMMAFYNNCSLEDISVCLAVPVVAVYPDRSEIVVHGGAVHLSKESLLNEQGQNSFGLVVELSNIGWSKPVEGAYVKKLSQEHGIIHASPELIESIKPGDLLGVLPVHSCLTADCMGGYLSLGGQVIDHCEG